MEIVIDLIIALVLGICVILGYKNGLTKSLIKILSFFIAIVVAGIFFKPVSNFIIANTEIDDNIKQSIVNIVSKDVEETGEVKEDSNLPQNMVEHINKIIKSSVEETKEKAIERASEDITIIIINIGSAILLFIVTRLVLFVITLVSDFLTDLPVIKQFDKTGGIIYGLLKALLIIFIIFAIISLISPAIEKTGIVKAINKSFIGSYLYNNNILLNIIL